jgi:hypothetical protein
VSTAVFTVLPNAVVDLLEAAFDPARAPGRLTSCPPPGRLTQAVGWSVIAVRVRLRSG